MPFTDTCKDIKLEAPATLVAKCLASDNVTYKESKLSLDTLIGNVDGEFRWGSGDFSKTAESITINKVGELTADLKTTAGVKSKKTLNLNTNIANKNGVLMGVNIPDVAQAKPTVKATEDLKIDITSAKGSAESVARTASLSTSGSLTAVSEKSQYFSESKYSETKSSFKSVRTMTMSFAQSTKNLKISEAGVLSAECLLADGEHWKLSTFDLYKYLGNVKGELTWGDKDFHRTSECFRFEGTKLFAKCKLSDGKAIKESWFDIATKLRSDNGVIVVIQYDEGLSTMLSEVPWMKFKVVAEPDFSVIASHPVMQATMHKIAQSTVDHVTAQMSSIMALAIAGAIEVVTKSAYEHISQSMEVMVQGVTADAQVHASVNTASKLHTFGEEIGLTKEVKGVKEIKA